MKRTTYIMIGMLVTGVAMVCGLMFYVVDRNVTQKDNFMEIGGERKTVQLPSCRVGETAGCVCSNSCPTDIRCRSGPILRFSAFLLKPRTRHGVRNLMTSFNSR